jgi:hypothetical protein
MAVSTPSTLYIHPPFPFGRFWRNVLFSRLPSARQSSMRSTTNRVLPAYL